MKIPPINLDGNAVPHARWLEERALEADAELRELRAFRAAVSKQLGMTAGSATETNVQVETNRTDIIELKARAGIPPGGSAGMTVTRDSVTGLPVWTSVPYAATPEYWVSLETGNAGWDTNLTSAGKDALPAVTFDDDGHTMLPIWIEEDTLVQAPITLNVEVIPHGAGEQFDVYLPAAGSYAGGSPQHFIFQLYNSTAYQTTVMLWENNFYYAGTNTEAAPDRTRVVDPGEMLLWYVQSGGSDWTNSQVFPYSAGEVGRIGFTDRYYTRSVASMREHDSWCATGTLEVTADELPLRNGYADAKVIGRVTADLGTASAGADVLVDVKRNGTSIFMTPLVVPAGSTQGAKVPDVETHIIDYYSGVDWGVAGFDPDDVLTVEIVQVGSPGTEGSGITVTVYYG